VQKATGQFFNLNLMTSMKHILVLWTIFVLGLSPSFTCMGSLTKRRDWHMWKTKSIRPRKDFISSSRISNLMHYSRCWYSYLGQIFQAIYVKSGSLGKILEHRYNLLSKGIGLRVQIIIFLFNTMEHSLKLPMQLRVFETQISITDYYYFCTDIMGLAWTP
jgi:hypothetical protein